MAQADDDDGGDDDVLLSALTSGFRRLQKRQRTSEP